MEDRIITFTHGAYAVEATIRGARGEPGSASITDTLYVDLIIVRDAAGQEVRLDWDAFDPIYDEAERLAGIRQ